MLVTQGVGEQVDPGAARVGGVRAHIPRPRQEPVEARQFGGVVPVSVPLVGEHRQGALVAVQLGVQSAEQAQPALLDGGQQRLQLGCRGRVGEVFGQEIAEDDVDGTARGRRAAVRVRDLAEVAGDPLDPVVGQLLGEHPQPGPHDGEVLHRVHHGDDGRPVVGDVRGALGVHGPHHVAQGVLVAESVPPYELLKRWIRQHRPVDVGVLEAAERAGDIEFEEFEPRTVVIEVGPPQREVSRSGRSA